MTGLICEKAINFTLEQEGGFVNNPHDKGGETKYGISKKAYPFLDIENLTLDQAKDIYKRDYWDKCKCDFLPDALSVAVFDFAVNSGVKRATKYLQECLGVTVDGIIGNQTIGAAWSKPLKPVIEEYHKKRLNYYMTLPDWKYFGNGWGSRVERTKRKCEELI